MLFHVQEFDKYIQLTSTAERITHDNSSELKALFTDVSNKFNKSVIVDLNTTKYVDSSGIAAILLGKRLIKESGNSYVLFNVQSHVQKMLSITKVDRDINITPTKDEAIDVVFIEAIEREIED
jgi:anti-anti-sigma factor